MRKRIIVTGINGFVGKHLAKELSQSGCEVIGVDRSATAQSSIEATLAEYHQADLTKLWPEIPDADAIIHLAGLAAVGPSFDNPQDYITINSSIVTNMCEYYLKQA